MNIKKHNGWIFGPHNPPRDGDSLLWVIGNTVQNGLWDLKVSPDKKTAYISYTNSTVYNLCDAPPGHDYNNVLNEAERLLGIKSRYDE